MGGGPDAAQKSDALPLSRKSMGAARARTGAARHARRMAAISAGLRQAQLSPVSPGLERPREKKKEKRAEEKSDEPRVRVQVLTDSRLKRYVTRSECPLHAVFRVKGGVFQYAKVPPSPTLKADCSLLLAGTEFSVSTLQSFYYVDGVFNTSNGVGTKNTENRRAAGRTTGAQKNPDCSGLVVAMLLGRVASIAPR